MDPLFSHAPEPSATPEPAPAAPAASESLTLPLAPEQAAEAVIDYLHLWWPAASVLEAQDAAGAHLWWDAEGFGAELEDGHALQLAETTEWEWPDGASLRVLAGPAEGATLTMRASGGPEGTLLAIAGDPELVREVSVSFARFMGISN
ncbi:hypothetical protein DWB68_15255 [Galactobacter valiniphilus]|uniref:SRPBCC domain-containing protein n=1 Tax=Galactobacter valiniphilus TaxID=2676122 RepID=A0A399JAA8_9MICC|nr:hypothetical protein [Galactobacter valiniphilus]RII40952.1 hypothetical protein DWB68_15255 [Galactobacter valiniphilus]